MLVKNWMNRQVVGIDPNDSMQHAISLMRDHRIRMLPVIKGGKLVGILTDRDLKRVSASDATTLEIHELKYLLSDIRIKDIMKKNPITVNEHLTVEETAEILLENKISGVPVVENGDRVVGVITQSDLFRVLISLTGIGSRGMQYAFIVEDRPGSIKELADIIRSYGGRMVSILTSYEKVPPEFRRVYIRMHSVDRTRIDALTEALRLKARVLYLIDHKQNRRELYEEEGYPAFSPA